MKLIDYHRSFLVNTVNLNQTRLDLLQSRVESIYVAAAMDPILGPFVEEYVPQGILGARNDHQARRQSRVRCRHPAQDHGAPGVGRRQEEVRHGDARRVRPRGLRGQDREAHPLCPDHLCRRLSRGHRALRGTRRRTPGDHRHQGERVREFEPTGLHGLDEGEGRPHRREPPQGDPAPQAPARLQDDLQRAIGDPHHACGRARARLERRGPLPRRADGPEEHPRRSRLLAADVRDDAVDRGPELPRRQLRSPVGPGSLHDVPQEDPRLLGVGDRGLRRAGQGQERRTLAEGLRAGLQGAGRRGCAADGHEVGITGAVRARSQGAVHRGSRVRLQPDPQGDHYATVARRVGFRHGNLRAMGSVGKGRSIDFRVRTDVPSPYAVFWKVRNFGTEAAAVGQLRGLIEDGTAAHTKRESTSYTGTHWVECYVVKDRVVRATDRHLVRIR